MEKSKVNVLLVEGKRANGSSVESVLENMAYRVWLANTGQQALQTAAEEEFQIVVFNSATMRSNGARSCRRLRTANESLPIIHIRPSNQPIDETAEADVYLEQPFTPRKLRNRINALLPADRETEEIVRCGAITYYRNKRSVEVNGSGESIMTPKLAHLLEEFIRNYNQVVTRKQLMQKVWNTDYVGDTRTLDVHIRWVRELIEENPAKPIFLTTVRGKGYILKVPEEA
ncbi:MAG: response regulator transcription factor [Chloroflexota bacterium]